MTHPPLETMLGLILPRSPPACYAGPALTTSRIAARRHGCAATSMQCCRRTHSGSYGRNGQQMIKITACGIDRLNSSRSLCSGRLKHSSGFWEKVLRSIGSADLPGEWSISRMICGCELDEVFCLTAVSTLSRSHTRSRVTRPGTGKTCLCEPNHGEKFLIASPPYRILIGCRGGLWGKEIRRRRLRQVTRALDLVQSPFKHRCKEVECT